MGSLIIPIEKEYFRWLTRPNRPEKPARSKTKEPSLGIFHPSKRGVRCPSQAVPRGARNPFHPKTEAPYSPAVQVRFGTISKGYVPRTRWDAASLKKTTFLRHSNASSILSTLQHRI